MNGISPRQRLTALAIAATAAVAVGGGTASADHSFPADYHWARAANPVTLTLGNAAGGGLNDVQLEKAAADWSLSSVIDLTVVPSTADPAACPFVDGRIEVCAADYGDTGWYGQAGFKVDRKGHIVAARARINNFNVGDPVLRQHVICHEIGHTLGLAHENPDPDSCLTNAAVGEQSVGIAPSPNAHDYEQLEVIYEHADSSARNGKGKANGHAHGTTVADLASGYRLVTVRLDAA